MAETASKLGSYLRDRRARLDPAALGFATGRPDLGMMVYNPLTTELADRIRAFIASPSG